MEIGSRQSADLSITCLEALRQFGRVSWPQNLCMLLSKVYEASRDAVSTPVEPESVWSTDECD